MSCTITAWFGRLGNNVWQVCKAVYVCKKMGLKGVHFPNHEFFKTTYIPINESSSNVEVIQDTFFYTVVDCSLEDLKKMCMEYIRPIVTFEYKDPIDETVIHFRGGDVFGNNPHGSYVQPPLKYYTEILDNRPCIIVKEDDRNPCIKHINNAKTFRGTLKNDFEMLLQAKELICGKGTFCLAVYLLSEHIQIVHMPYTMYKTLPGGDTDVEFRVYDFENYIDDGNWSASKDQLELMVKYSNKLSLRNDVGMR